MKPRTPQEDHVEWSDGRAMVGPVRIEAFPPTYKLDPEFGAIQWRFDFFCGKYAQMGLEADCDDDEPTAKRFAIEVARLIARVRIDVGAAIHTQGELEAAANRAHGDPDAFGRVVTTEPEVEDGFLSDGEPDVLVQAKCDRCDRVLSVPSRETPFVCGWCIELRTQQRTNALEDENIAMVGPESWCSNCETIQPCTEEQLVEAIRHKNFVCAECQSTLEGKGARMLLNRACRYIEGLQSMQAMPSKEFDDEVDKFLTQVRGMLETPPGM